MSRRINLVLMLLVIVGLAASFSVLIQRIRVENNSKTVQLVLDSDDCVEFTSACGYPLDEFLIRMKEAGVNSIAVQEARVRDLVDDGQALLLSADPENGKFLEGSVAPTLKGALERASELQCKSVLILPKSDWVIGFIRDLSTRLVEDTVTSELVESREGSRYVVATTVSPTRLARQRYGIDRNKVTSLKALGFGVVPRYANFRKHSPRSIRTMLEQLDWVGEPSLVIINGTSVLGYKKNIPATAEMLKQQNATVGVIEFAPQKGIMDLVLASDFQAIRVHSISSSEMDVLPTVTVVERFVRAARERGIRVMYVRPIPEAHDSVRFVAENCRYISNLVSSLEDAGFSIGTAKPLDKLSTETSILILVALGIFSSVGLLSFHVVHASPRFRMMTALLGVGAFCAALFFGRNLITRQFAALIAALTMPVLAVVPHALSTRRTETKIEAPYSSVRSAFVLLVWICVISAMGGLLVVGILGDTQFMLKVQQFIGVKLTHVVPVALTAWILLGGRTWLRGFEMKLRLERFRELYNSSVPVRYLAWSALVALVGLVYISRTGNSTFLPVLDIEREFRLLLERILVARPRTKEILLAHPLLMLGLVLIRGKYRRWGLWAMIVGTIGQASIINTFSHIHTPVLISVARWALGIVAGGAIGSLLIFAVDWAVRRYVDSDGILQNSTGRRKRNKAHVI